MPSCISDVVFRFLSGGVPLRFITGPDKTEAVVPDKNLSRQEVETPFRGKSVNVGRVLAILGCFLGRTTWAIDKPGLLRLLGLCIQEVERPGTLADTLILNMGIGGSEDGVPLRSVAYGMPILHAMMELRELNVPLPRARLFTGQQLAMYCLRKNVDLLWANTTITFTLIKLFAKKFFPAVTGQLFFDFDRPISSEIEDTLKVLVRTLKQRSASDHDLAEVVAVLERMSLHHGGNLDSALLYGAGHPLVFGDFVHAGRTLTPFIETLSPTSHVQMTSGTRAEMEFWAVRKALTTEASCALAKVRAVPWIMMVTWIGGEKPPYYRHPQGDLNWTEAHRWWERYPKLPKSVQQELDLLAAATAGPGNLVQWAGEVWDSFSVVEGTGPYPMELLAHSILGNEVVRSEIEANHYVDAALCIAEMSSEAERKLVMKARKAWMQI